MSVRRILTVPNPILREKSISVEKVDKESKNIDKKVSNSKYNLFRRQYVLLWEYMTEKFDKTENINLGEGHVSNLSTGIL